MTAHLLIRAAELLEREASIMRDSFQTGDGSWAIDDLPIKAEHDELLDLARKLRELPQSPTAFAVQNDQGYFAGIYRDRTAAETVLARGQPSHNERLVELYAL